MAPSAGETKSMCYNLRRPFERYKYEPLNPSEDEIRLFHIDLNKRRADREYDFTISTVSLRRSKPQYWALSYTWGEFPKEEWARIFEDPDHEVDSQAKDLLAHVTVDGSLVPVSRNLVEALEQVRVYLKKHYSDSRNRVSLWCDQICIDQWNELEKNYQVASMHTIYDRAEEVLIWLPLFFPEPHRTTIRRLSWKEWRARCESYIDISQNPDDQVDTDKTWKYSLRAWQDVRAILESPWWRRAWVYQEFIFGTRATFLLSAFSQCSVAWEELSEFVNVFISRLSAHGQAIEILIKEQVSKRKEISQTLHSLNAEKCLLADKRRRALFPGVSRSLRKKTRSLSDQEISIRMEQDDNYTRGSTLESYRETLIAIHSLWAIVSFMFRSKGAVASVRTPMLLSNLLSHASNTRCLDPRDKIFAFLGLVDSSYGIAADYAAGNSFRQVYSNASAAIIRTELNLNVLITAIETASDATPGIPSWVPSLRGGTTINAGHLRFLQAIEFPSSGCKASRSMAPVYSFHPDRDGQPNSVLTARGIRVDSLLRITEDPPREPWRRFDGSTGLDIATRSIARPGDEVWILFGLDIPLVLSRPSARDPFYTIIGHAMLWENRKPSPILDGSLIQMYHDGKVDAEDVSII